MYERLVVGIRLYHGTMDVYARDISQNGIDLSKSKKYLDFGPGFYTTPILDFAKETAVFRTSRYNRFSKKHRGSAVVCFEVDESEWALLKVKRFPSASTEWQRFVIANRMTNTQRRERYQHNGDQRFDCVIGPTADGKAGSIDYLVDQVDKGFNALEDLNLRGILPSRKNKWGMQYSFHTLEAISTLRITESLFFD